AAGCPDVTPGYPAPVVVRGSPVAGLPVVVVGSRLIHPGARHPEVVVTGSGHIRPLFKRLGRIRQVLEVRDLCAGPETGHPGVTAGGCAPVAGHPSLPGGDASPRTADPEVVFDLIVAGPVAGNPLDVVSLGHELGGN